MRRSHSPAPAGQRRVPLSGRTGPFPPDFLIIGAQKCGTTSLADALRAHPQIFIPIAKEADHFGLVPDDEAGGARYRKFFSEWGGQPIVGEASPNYLFLTRSAAQIGRVLPAVKVIVLLRNPVDRAYSGYWQRIRRGTERRPFSAVIEAELAGERELPRDQRSVTLRGHYAEQLQPYVEVGFDRDRMLVLMFEEVVADGSGALGAVQRFLGVEEVLTELPRSSPVSRSILPVRIRRVLSRHWRNPLVSRILPWTRRPFEAPPMDPAVRTRLVDHYRPHNARLAELLGRDLPDWDR